MKWIDDGIKTWLDILEIEWRCKFFFIDNVSRKHVGCALKAVECEAVFIGYDAVAQADGFTEELLIEVHYN